MAIFKAQMAEDEFKKFLEAQGVEKDDVDETIRVLIDAGELKRLPNGFIEFPIGVNTPDEDCDGCQCGQSGQCGQCCHDADEDDKG